MNERDQQSMSIFDSGKSFKFDEEGASITGTIEEWKEQQQMEYDRKTNSRTDKPATYDDGNAIMELVFTLVDTNAVREDANDDGRRYVYVSTTRAKKATIAAVRGAGKKVPEVGGVLTVTYVGKDPTSFEGRGKAYTVSYVPPTAVSQTFGTDTAPAPAAAAPVAQAPAQAAAAAVLPTTPPATVQPAAAPATDPRVTKAMELISLGIDDATIVTALGLDAAVVAALRPAVTA